MTEKPAPDPGTGVDAELRALREELTHLREHKMVVLYQSPAKVLLFKMLGGMAVGLGTVIGATVLLSVIIWMLSTIEFIPIIGEWAVNISNEIEALTGAGE